MWLLLGSCSDTTREQQPESLTTNWHNYETVNAAPNTWTSQDPPFLNNLQPPFKRDGENGKPRESEQNRPNYLRSVHIVNDHTQSNPLIVIPLIIHQPDNTPDNCAKHIQVHGKPKVNFVRNHI